MATIYVNSAAVGANDGSSWADAFTTILAALAVATVADKILVSSTHNAAVASSLLYTPVGINITSVLIATEVYTPGAIETSTIADGAIQFSGGLFAGITFVAGPSGTSAGVTWSPGAASATNIQFKDCNFQIRSVDSAFYRMGSPDPSYAYHTFVNCSFKFGATTQGIAVLGGVHNFVGCSIDIAGSIPATLFFTTISSTGDIRCLGCDWGLAVATLITRDTSDGLYRFTFVQCKFNAATSLIPSGSLTVSDTRTTAYYYECTKGATTGVFGYASIIGSMFRDTATLYTGGLASSSWAVTTSVNVSASAPFYTPWVDLHNTVLSNITPYVEVLRNNGSAAAYTNAEIWAEFSVEATASSTLGTFLTDRVVPNATPVAQAAGAGTGSWTIAASSSPFSMKLDSGGAVLPLTTGLLRGRIGIAVPSLAGTLYIDPQIRI